MPRRGPLAPAHWAVLVFGALGLLAGLVGVESLLETPLTQAAALYPRPVSTLWWESLRGLAGAVVGSSLPLRAGLIALSLGALVMLGSVLTPGFRLLKPPGENPGQGATAHVDLPLVGRAALAAFLSFWLVGAFQPLALLAPPGRPATLLLFLTLGGLPVWTGFLPGVLNELALPLALSVSLWLLWGPGGLAAGKWTGCPGVSTLWGLGAGGILLPAVAAVQAARFWLPQTGSALSLADPAGWKALLAWTLILPLSAALLTVVAAVLFRPRPVDAAARIRLALASVAVGLLGIAGLGRTREALARLDVGKPSLALELGLQGSSLSRYALLLGPDTRVLPSVTADGTATEGGRDRIECNLRTIRAAQQFLERRDYRTALALRAYRHLHGCAALDWQTTRALEIDLETLERTPTPAAAERLLERLGQCRVTSENRRILDALADPARFRWKEPKGRRWLGAAYLRFGEMERAREFLLHSGMSQAELQQAFGGLSPLTDGTVRGQVTIQGERIASVRMGLVRADGENWKEVAGLVPPEGWGRVCAMTHTDGEGRFEFRNIPEGSYYLIVTGGGLGRTPGQPVVTPHPGAVQLDRVHPVRTLPAFDIRLQAPLSAPGDGGVTA